VWMSVQTFGMEAFRRAVGRGMELAERAGDHIRESTLLELLSPPSLGVVCFRVNPEAAELDDETLEELNEAIQTRVIESRTAMMSSTRLKGTYSLRLCIMSYQTTWRDVEETLEAIESFAEEALQS